MNTATSAQSVLPSEEVTRSRAVTEISRSWPRLTRIAFEDLVRDDPDDREAHETYLRHFGHSSEADQVRGRLAVLLGQGFARSAESSGELEPLYRLANAGAAGAIQAEGRIYTLVRQSQDLAAVARYCRVFAGSRGDPVESHLHEMFARWLRLTVQSGREEPPAAGMRMVWQLRDAHSRWRNSPELVEAINGLANRVSNPGERLEAWRAFLLLPQASTAIPAGAQVLMGGFAPAVILVASGSGDTLSCSSLPDEPSLSFHYANPSGLLRVFFEAGRGDSTLAVQDPQGRCHFNDDGGGNLNPLVSLRAPSEGPYRVYVGRYGGNRGAVSGNIGLTESADEGPQRGASREPNGFPAMRIASSSAQPAGPFGPAVAQTLEAMLGDTGTSAALWVTVMLDGTLRQIASGRGDLWSRMGQASERAQLAAATQAWEQTRRADDIERTRSFIQYWEGISRHFEVEFPSLSSARGLLQRQERALAAAQAAEARARATLDRQCQDASDDIEEAEDGGSCSNTCRWANDGECDDGGPGHLYSICRLGTDCDDCGPRGACDFSQCEERCAGEAVCQSRHRSRSNARQRCIDDYTDERYEQCRQRCERQMASSNRYCARIVRGRERRERLACDDNGF